MKPKSNRTGVPAMDMCQTPHYGVEPLLPYLDPAWTVWEPAAGEGFLADALASRCKVIAGDVLTGQDFFAYRPDAWDVTITNPPYSQKYKWLQRCYELGTPFALLVPVETLGAKTAQELFKRYGFEIMLLDGRIDFSMPNRGFAEEGWKSSAQFPVLWLCWNLLPAPVVYGHLKKTLSSRRSTQRKRSSVYIQLPMFEEEGV